ncbi:MAG: MBL fold metallo-hydrolase, partial [Deltaproteobacteria bacterium]|nr:MBL fold metallo-hydrolase [Deltaproteobacteria bacterium]
MHKNIPFLKISVIFNNLRFNANLKTIWGFSCLIEGAEKIILFDTGDDGKILLENMRHMNIDPEAVDTVFL